MSGRFVLNWVSVWIALQIVSMGCKLFVAIHDGEAALSAWMTLNAIVSIFLLYHVVGMARRLP